MMKMRIPCLPTLLVGLMLTPSCSAQVNGGCAQYSETWSWDFKDYFWGAEGHTWFPGHGVTGQGHGSCQYTGSQGKCNTYCNDNTHNYTKFENGQTLINYWYPHTVGAVDVSTSMYTVGGGATCGSQLAVTVVQCNLLFACDATITMKGTVNGVDGTITFPPTNIMESTHPDLAVCDAMFGGGSTPIIIDLGGGYHISLREDGVPFNFFGTGLVQVSWPETGANNGFLVLPDKDGMVATAKQMFGNFTPQPPSIHPNGFLALAQYDKPEKGGNEDGVISSQDQIWPDLRVWIDANRDGVSQPGELHTLDELGIDSISLRYTSSPYIDDNGNAFRYKGSIVMDPKDKVVTIYDVFLQAGPIVK